MAAVALVALLLSACGSHGSMAGDLTGRAADIAFAQAMIPHHEQALEMSEIALASGAGPAVADLAREIRRAQDPEIILMRQWLKDWGAQEAPHGADPSAAVEDDGHDELMPGMMSADEMLVLAQATGRDLDRMWLEMMIAHHEGAIEMAEQVLATTDDLEVEALAQAVVDGQSGEIDRMRAILDR